MNICLVSYEYPPMIYGGAGTYAKLLYDGLTKKGLNVNLITHSEHTEPGDHYVLRSPDIKYWRRLFFSYYSKRVIEKMNEKNKLDVIHFNEPHIIPVRLNFPTVSTFHSTQINEIYTKILLSKVFTPGNMTETLIKSPIGSFTDILSSLNSDHIICPNNHLKYMINKFCFKNSDSISAIPNGINVDDLNTFNYDFDFFMEENRYILFVGRIDPIKGIEYLIKAYKIINKKHKDIKLVIVGTGLYESYIKQISDDKNIVFIGHVSDKMKLSQIYKNSLMVVLPSLYEALPMVLLEAMACGKPVVASRVGGIPDVIEDGINGFLVEPRDIMGLYEKILYLIENYSFLKKMGENNVSYVQKHFNLDLMIERTIKVYERVV